MCSAAAVLPAAGPSVSALVQSVRSPIPWVCHPSGFLIFVTPKPLPFLPPGASKSPPEISVMSTSREDLPIDVSPSHRHVNNMFMHTPNTHTHTHTQTHEYTYTCTHTYK